MVLLVGIDPMCLLVTKVSLKTLQCARLCLHQICNMKVHFIHQTVLNAPE